MKKIIYTVLAVAPTFAFAADPNFSAITALLNFAKTAAGTLIPLFIAAAVIFFFWGLVQFLRGAGDPKTHEAGKSHMILGIIVIAIMVSLSGIIAWLQNITGVGSSNGTFVAPTVQGIPSN